MKDIVPANAALDKNLNQGFGMLFERLLYEDCRQEFKAVFKSGIKNPVGASFKTLGVETMKLLISHPSQEQHSKEPFKYVDMDRFEAFFMKTLSEK